MSERERKEIQEMVETAELLAKHDPQGLMIAKANIDILKARCEIERSMKKGFSEHPDEEIGSDDTSENRLVAAREQRKNKT